MVVSLTVPLAGVCLVLLSTAVSAAELSDRHELRIVLDWTSADTRSPLGAWPEAGFGKLRYDADGPAAGTSRLSLEYSGRIAPTVFGRAVLDYVDDADTRAGLTELFAEWRPLPSGPSRHRLRFGAFYPAFSLENSGVAWGSPYTRNYSAINAWFGEEIRNFGAEWRVTRTLGPPGSPHGITAHVGAFFGNDPAATLLFWRGFAVHDRQTRIAERLPLPPLIFSGQNGAPPRVIERRLDPFSEIDDRPGFYAGVEWELARRARLSLTGYDNRGDPDAFRNGQWAWGTRFWQIGGQFEMPYRIGVVAQRMRGDTDWLIFANSDGTLSPATRLVTDEFDAYFVLVSREIRSRHRVSLRHDEFDFVRPGDLVIDDGDARMISYSYSVNSRLSMHVESLEIRSRRDLWPQFYGQTARDAKEQLVQLGFRLELLNSAN